MYVGQIHERYFTIWIVLWALAASAPRPVRYGRGVRPGVHYQDLLLLVPYVRRDLEGILRVVRAGRV